MGTEMSDQVRACLEKAADCRRRALLVTDETHRKTYLELARLWRDMAEQAEMLNSRRLAALGESEKPQGSGHHTRG
jgi:hypothetical protein